MMKQLQKQLLEDARLPTPQLAAQEAAVHATASWSSEAMLRLEPEQPQSWFLAATLHTERQRPASMREALEMNFHAIQLAQQQRSSLWVIKAGFSAVMMVAGQRTCAGSSGVGTAGNDSLSLKEVQAMAAAASQSRNEIRGHRSCKCHGCGRQAVGLRKCARCKQAQYCRWVHRQLLW